MAAVHAFHTHTHTLTFRVRQGATRSLCWTNKPAVDEEAQTAGMVIEPCLTEKTGRRVVLRSGTKQNTVLNENKMSRFVFARKKKKRTFFHFHSFSERGAGCGHPRFKFALHFMELLAWFLRWCATFLPRTHAQFRLNNVLFRNVRGSGGPAVTLQGRMIGHLEAGKITLQVRTSE